MLMLALPAALVPTVFMSPAAFFTGRRLIPGDGSWPEMLCLNSNIPYHNGNDNVGVCIAGIVRRSPLPAGGISRPDLPSGPGFPYLNVSSSGKNRILSSCGMTVDSCVASPKMQ
jgi:hypothetical protein